MARLPRITAAQLIRVLERNGFVLDRQRKHRIYMNVAGQRVTVPYHAAKTLKPKTLKSILRDAGWSVEEFISLMEDA